MYAYMSNRRESESWTVTALYPLGLFRLKGRLHDCFEGVLLNMHMRV